MPWFGFVLTTYLKYAKDKYIYERNQSGCEKAKKMGFVAFTLCIFLTIDILFALLKINMRFKHVEAGHIMSFDS